MNLIFDYVSTNLKTIKKEELSFPFLDYGYLYGYGLFETIKISNGRPLLIKEHIDRIRKASAALDIPFNFLDSEVLEEVKILISRNQVEEGVLNFYLTPGNREVDPAKVAVGEPFFLMLIREWPGYKDTDSLSLEVRPQSFQKTPLDRYKTLSWVKNVLENKLTTYDDVILYDEKDALLETTRSNIFLIKDNTIVTPKSSVILSGVVRGFVLKKASFFGYDVDERPVSVEELPFFDEIFLTNSIRGIIQVSNVKDYPNLRSGNNVLKLQEMYKETVLAKESVG